MKLTIIGTGYVGLVTGACFAEMGNAVTCVDIDAVKIEGLQHGVVPIYEPGLGPMLLENIAQGRLRFTTRLEQALADSNVYFIAVGTPPDADGSADLRHVLAVATDIGRHMTHYCVVVDKSTVPVGTAERVKAAVCAQLDKRGLDIPFDVVANPEFLKEGDAVADFMRPDRIIVGCEGERPRELMRDLYAPFMRNHERLLFMGLRDAEMTKYAANAMLATRISFMNEIAGLCDRLGVDVEAVRHGIGSDSRIGYAFIYPGCGYGGSCFPKDVKAVIHMAEEYRWEPSVLKAVQSRNERQKHVLFENVVKRFGTRLNGHSFGVWGLAFKPGTDDMREAPSVSLINALIEAGAVVRAYDPVAMDEARRTLPPEWFEKGRLTLAENQYEAVKDVDALALVTEWKPFRYPDFDLLKRIMRKAVIFDGRNQYDPRHVRAAGFEYKGIGR